MSLNFLVLILTLNITCHVFAEDKLAQAPIQSPENKNDLKNKTATAIQNVTTSSSILDLPKRVPDVESGALLRGVSVFIALSVLFLIYLGVKTYFSNKNKNSQVIVRKYGVRTRRSDIEMTPLPLDEDEDDETVFEVGHVER